MLSGDEPWNTEQKNFCEHALYDPSDGLSEIRDFYRTVTETLVREKSHKLRDTYQLDAIRDVGNLSHAIVVAHIFDIPLTGSGSNMTAEKFHEVMAAVFSYTFLDIDPAKSQALREAGKRATALLKRAVTPAVEAVKTERFHMLKEMIGMGNQDTALRNYGTNLVQRLFKGGKSVDEVVWTIIPTAPAAGPIQGQGVRFPPILIHVYFDFLFPVCEHILMRDAVCSNVGFLLVRRKQGSLGRDSEGRTRGYTRSIRKTPEVCPRGFPFGNPSIWSPPNRRCRQSHNHRW